MFYSLTSRWIAAQLDENLLVASTQIAGIVRERGLNLDRGDFDFDFSSTVPGADALLEDRMFFVRIVDRRTGEVIGMSANFSLPVDEHARDKTEHFATISPPWDDDDLRIYTVPLRHDTSFNLQIGMSLDEVRSTQESILRLLGVSLALTIILALTIGWFLGNRAIAPIRAVSQIAEEINETDLTRRLDTGLGDHELARLAGTFNSMLDRIEKAFLDKKEFTANAAHELRTPLSIMRTGVEVVLSRERTGAEYRASLENFYEELRRLTKLASSLLLLARGDAEKVELEVGDLDLTTLLDTVFDQCAPNASDRSIHMRAEIERGLR